MDRAARRVRLAPASAVTVYLDAANGIRRTAVAAQLPKATVYRTLTLPGRTRPLVSHAKFVIIDRAVLLTSANFSYSAENSNIEFGLLVATTPSPRRSNPR